MIEHIKLFLTDNAHLVILIVGILVGVWLGDLAERGEIKIKLPKDGER